jgi:HAD superfamily hydrolase (TIGR01509 family)
VPASEFWGEKIEMIKCIIFDLADTLVRGLTGIEEKLVRYIPLPKEQILTYLRGGWFIEFLLGNISEEDYLQELICRNQWNVDKSILKNIIRENFNHDIPGMADIVQQLSGRYLLVLLSNHGKEWAEYIEAVHGFLKMFKYRFYSYEMKCGKANPEIYLSLLKKTNLPPNNCLFIDDREKFLEIAKNEGIHTIKFENCERLKLSLREFGIKIK